MRSLRSILAFVAALILASCAGSPPTRFYVLSAVPGTTAPGGAGAAAPPVIAIGPVSLPDYVNRPGIVTREGANRVRVSAFDQWASSLPAMTARVLIQDVSVRLPGARVVPFDSESAQRPDLRVPVEIGQFDVDQAGHALLAAHWEIYDPTGAKTLSRGDTLARSEASGSSYDDRVAALSRALGILSDQISQAVAGLRAGRAPGPALP